MCFSRIDLGQLEKYFKKSREVFVHASWTTKASFSFKK